MAILYQNPPTQVGAGITVCVIWGQNYTPFLGPKLHQIWCQNYTTKKGPKLHRKIHYLVGARGAKITPILAPKNGAKITPPRTPPPAHHFVPKSHPPVLPAYHT